MIDFSDATKISIAKLGKMFSELNKVLESKSNDVIKLNDPSFFIDKFCYKLDLGDKERQVRDVALKILKSMKKDWIQTGRHPMGLVGCAVLLACRFYNLSFTIFDIAKQVKISPETIYARLMEFK